MSFPSVPNIGIRDNFFELGGHSLLALRLIMQMQYQFDKQLDLATLFQLPTIEQLAHLLRDEDAYTSGSILVEMRSGSGQKPLVFVHPSGGSVHWYTELAKLVNSQLPFVGIQARGLNDKTELHTSIVDMASFYVENLNLQYPEGPALLGGWSLGVIIAYEMARQLKLINREIGLLAILDQGPLIPNQKPEDESQMLVEIFKHYFPLKVEELRKMNSHERCYFVFKKAKRARIIPLFTKLSQFRRHIEILKIQTDAWRNYQIKPYGGDILLIKARENHDNLQMQKDLGWSEYVQGNIHIENVPGDHLSMMRDPHVTSLAYILNEYLDKQIKK